MMMIIIMTMMTMMMTAMVMMMMMMMYAQNDIYHHIYIFHLSETICIFFLLSFCLFSAGNCLDYHYHYHHHHTYLQLLLMTMTTMMMMTIHVNNDTYLQTDIVLIAQNNYKFSLQQHQVQMHCCGLDYHHPSSSPCRQYCSSPKRMRMMMMMMMMVMVIMTMTMRVWYCVRSDNLPPDDKSLNI